MQIQVKIQQHHVYTQLEPISTNATCTTIETTNIRETSSHTQSTSPPPISSDKTSDIFDDIRHLWWDIRHLWKHQTSDIFVFQFSSFLKSLSCSERQEPCHSIIICISCKLRKWPKKRYVQFEVETFLSVMCAKGAKCAVCMLNVLGAVYNYIMQCAVSSIRCAACSLQWAEYVVCHLHCAFHSVQCAVCIPQCAVCSG